MKILFDFFPILLFFIAYKMYDIYVATAVAIAATFLQVAAFWIKHHRFEKMHLVTLALMVVLGGSTLYLQNEMFIKWKPTVINWLFGIVFIFSHFFGERCLIQRMMQQSVSLPQHIWRKLNLSWGAFFILMGSLNLYVVYRFDTETWVNFKLFGILGLTLLFVIVQAIYMSKHIEQNGD